MYRITRYFSIASLASIVLAALLLGLLYRYTAIRGIVHLGEIKNAEVAETVLADIKPRLLRYLASVEHIDKPGAVITALDGRLTNAIQGIMQADKQVVRVKIYNKQGIVVFSTKTSQIGQDQREPSSGDKSENTGFQAAINGKVVSRVVYRDAFDYFKQPTEEDNLMQTYIPVRRSVAATIQGVLEIYTDVTPLVDYAEYTQVEVVGITAVILALLYVTLLVVVRRAEKIMEGQQNIIRERTETLEVLSAQLLTAEENEKKRLADELHEDVAQMLSAIKFQVEHAVQVAAQQSPEENAKSLASLVATVQEAIRKVSAMAMDLRPPSLDDLGVVTTIDWYLRQFQSHHPEILLESDIEIEESAVSRALKIIIYRIVQETLDNLAKFSMANLISVHLSKIDNNIALTIEDNGGMYRSGKTAASNTNARRTWLYAIEERAVLSGGTVSRENNAAGGRRIRFIWPV